MNEVSLLIQCLNYRSACDIKINYNLWISTTVAMLVDTDSCQKFLTFGHLCVLENVA